jgi:hypothetical protein
MARQKSDSFKRTVPFYDDNFDLQTKTVEGKIVTAKSLTEAKELFGNDDAKVLDALNSQLRENQISLAMNAASGGMEERFIMGFIKPMRSMVPFNTIEDEKAQTKAILEQVKTVPFLLEGLKSYCKIRSTEGDEE